MLANAGRERVPVGSKSWRASWQSAGAPERNKTNPINIETTLPRNFLLQQAGRARVLGQNQLDVSIAYFIDRGRSDRCELIALFSDLEQETRNRCGAASAVQCV